MKKPYQFLLAVSATSLLVTSTGVAQTKWTCETSNAEFCKRFIVQGASFNDKLWIFGGFDMEKDVPITDYWYSTTGKTWTKAPNALPSDASVEALILNHNGSLWWIGGNKGC